MRNATIFALITLASTIFVGSANAQTDFASCTVRPFDPVCRVMGGVYRQREEIRVRHAIQDAVRQGRDVADLYGLRDYAGAAIAPAIVGATSGVYGRSTSRRGRAIRNGAIGAAAGAGLGALIGRDGRSTAYGAAAGAGAGVALSLLAGRRDGVAGPSASGNYAADFFLLNSTGVPIEVYFVEQNGKERRKGLLPAGEYWPIDGRRLKLPRANTRESYVGYAVIPDDRGGLSSDRLVPRPTSNGWEFVEPPEAAGRRQ